MSGLENRAWALGLKHVPNWEGMFAPTRAHVLAAIKEALIVPVDAIVPEARERWKLEECTHDVRAALNGTHVRIWSGEHFAYWRPASAGYTTDGLGAGIYEFSDAYARTRHCGPEKRIAFEPIPNTATVQPKGSGQ